MSNNPKDIDPPAGFGYWQGSMNDLVKHWRDRALKAEAEVRELTRELREAVVHGAAKLR